MGWGDVERKKATSNQQNIAQNDARQCHKCHITGYRRYGEAEASAVRVTLLHCSTVAGHYYCIDIEQRRPSDTFAFLERVYACASFDFTPIGADLVPLPKRQAINTHSQSPLTRPLPPPPPWPRHLSHLDATVESR